MIVGRSATYNGAPRTRQRWTETYRRLDGSTITIAFLLLENGRESATVAEPSTRWRRQKPVADVPVQGSLL